MAAAAPFYDDFSSCTVGGLPDPSKWNVPLKQWGGDDINGGVNPKNVECVTDATLGKTVLQFTAHGDLYNGTGPIGVTHDGTPRAANDQVSGAVSAVKPVPHADDSRLAWLARGTSPVTVEGMGLGV